MNEDAVNGLELTDWYTVAARASINERCAPAFLHDVRGTMQALFSAFELLGRSAKMGGANPLRVEKACDLARRAITQHEKSTLDVLQLLTLQRHAACTVNLSELATEVTHFLRNDAATKNVSLTMGPTSPLNISVERSKLHNLLVGLVTAAIDAAPEDVELPVSVSRENDHAVFSIGCHTAFGTARNVDELLDHPLGLLHSSELTLLFARRFLESNGGRLQIDGSDPTRVAVRLFYPAS